MSANDQSCLALEADLEKFAKLMDIAPAVMTQRLALDIHGRISMRTPVDTGRARASWDLKEGSPSSYQPPEPAKGSKGTSTPKSVTAEAATITGKQIVFVTTALDYPRYLEQGTSKQAPAGMVLITLAEVELEIESIIGQLS